MKSSRIPAVVFVALLVALFPGCGGGDGDGETTTTAETTQTTQPSAGEQTTSSVKMDEYSFDPKDASVQRGDTLDVSNDGAIAHNLTIEQGPDPKEKSKKLAGTSTFLPNKSEKLKVDLKPGTYAMVCTVAGHRELGMTGDLTVR